MYKVKYFLYRLLNNIFKIPFLTSKRFVISPTARVNYLGIRNNKNNILKVGDGTTIDGSIVFEKEDAAVTIGKNTYIGSSNIICADKISIGNNILIAWGCTIIDHNSHSLSAGDRAKDISVMNKGKKDWSNVSKKPVKIEDNVWIGFNSIILKGVTVGKGAIVGAGSVVPKNVKPYTVVAGNPAKFIKNINEK